VKRKACLRHVEVCALHGRARRAVALDTMVRATSMSPALTHRSTRLSSGLFTRLSHLRIVS
jgi:hypothetical protein